MIRLAFRLLARDWRSGELHVLVLAIMVAVASLASVGFLADRVSGALERDVNRLLGGDLVLIADAPWDDAVLAQAGVAGLASASAVNLVSMVRHGEEAQLAAVKAVSANYPLRGELRISTREGSLGQVVGQGPPPGEAWVEARLLSTLSIGVGDSIEVGNSSFKVTGLVTAEPDRGIGFLNLAPRVMIAASSLPATGLVQPASRARFQIYLAGAADDVARFRRELSPVLARGQSIQGVDNARPEVRSTLDRAQRFLGLAALLAAVLAGVAVSLAARRHANRHRDAWALMRCMGSSGAALLGIALVQLAAIAVVATLAGCLIAVGLQSLMSGLIEAIGGTRLPSPSLWPVVQAFVLATLLLLGGALPPVLQLRAVPALRVIRRDAGAPRAGALASIVAAGLALAVAILWQARDLRLAALSLGGLCLGAALIAGLAAVLLFIVERLPLGASFHWRQAVRSLTRHRAAAILQACALCLGITAILMLVFTRSALLSGWQARVPADAPDHFIINVQPEQREPIGRVLLEQQRPSPQWFPMIRARLVSINGRTIKALAYPDDRARRLVEREFNLSWAAEPPPGNDLVQGHWFRGPDELASGLSVEEGIARTLGIAVGDRLDWMVAGTAVSGTVVNLRRLHWDSLQVNFFVVSAPPLLETFPASYITSIHLGQGADRLVGRLLRDHPNLTVIDTSALIGQLLDVIAQVSAAVQVLFLFTLAAGVLVLYGALVMTQDDRLQEAAVMRALGASRSQLVMASRIEYLAIGVLAGLMGALLASVAGWFLAVRVFEVAAQSQPLLWLAGPALGAACALWNARVAARLAVARTPVAALRAAA